MRLGLIARADNSGLGVQTLEFYRHMQPTKTMVVDISKFNNNPIFPERYPDGVVVRGFPTPNDIERFLEGLDVVFVAESPYSYYLYERARELGVKTAVQYNYEFFDWFANPHYPKPDMLIAPSRWHFDDVQAWCRAHNIKHVYLHCPVARGKLPFRRIAKAEIFLHNAGRSAAHDRNGTETVIAASKYLTSQALIKVHFQAEQGLAHQATHTFEHYFNYLNQLGGNNIVLQQQEFDDYTDVYKTGDVLLLPRRYGGNCLPLNEALSVGMPVIMTDISPNNAFLPPEWLIPANKINSFTPRTVVDIYDSDPVALAAKIDWFYNLSEADMLDQNQHANVLAATISWQAMKPLYQQALEQLCSQ